MLTLTRRPGEEIVVGDPKDPIGLIRITDIRPDKVKIAFDFPRDMEINRLELAREKATNPKTGSDD